MYLAKWDSPLASHVRLTHFKGDIFNVSTLTGVVSLTLLLSNFAKSCALFV